MNDDAQDDQDAERKVLRTGQAVDNLFRIAMLLGQAMEWPSEDVPRLCAGAGAQMFFAVHDTFQRREAAGQTPKDRDMGITAMHKCATDVLTALTECSEAIRELVKELPPPPGAALQ